MFDALLRDAPKGQSPSFLHCLYPSPAHADVLSDNVDGLPRVGVVADIVDHLRDSDGVLAMKVEATRRASLVTLRQDKPYMVRNDLGCVLMLLL